MAFFASNPLQQNQQLYPIALCKCPWTLNSFKFHFPSHFLAFSPPKHSVPEPSSSPLVARAHDTQTYNKLSSTDQQPSNNTKKNYRNYRRTLSGFSDSRASDKRVDRKFVKNTVSSVVEEDTENIAGKERHDGKRMDSRKGREMGYGFSSIRSKEESLVKKLTDTIGSILVKEKEGKKPKKRVSKKLGVQKIEKGAKKSKVDSSEGTMRARLDMCSKKGDVMGALKLYDSAQKEGIKMGQYHYTVLLYLCSSAATGVVRPAKSGSGSRSLSTVDSMSDVPTMICEDLGEVGGNCKKNSHSTEPSVAITNNELLVESIDHPIDLVGIELDSNKSPTEVGKENFDSSFNGMEKTLQVSNGVAKPNHKSGVSDLENLKDYSNPENYEIRVSEDLKRYALRRGFEVYEKMCLENVPMNEASLTSVARMALAMGDGDKAFNTVKQMKELGINPRLRSYGPALSAFCNCGDIGKAFAVEEHMLENGVHPEEPELVALLKLSIEAGRSDKVYYLLHKLRTGVRKVSPSTADLIVKWFNAKVASKVGKRKWDPRLIREAIENGGGGWHGQGWLGKGKWKVSRTSVGEDGLCKCCGEKLATIDLDPIETEKFAESVASIATKREKNSSFQKFQKWLDYYGPFEAVVDGANVGLFTQRKFKPSKVNAVVNGIRQLLPSKKWPLIVLHNRRITGDNINKPVNKALIEKWKTADAIYSTPTGSNDDWYWLYAAIKFKCLIVTNDEMRDHLFQLLGDDFFPKWKERHQVHFSFSETGPVFHMPPPCSVVIQESQKGHWHIPIASEHEFEEERTWLCITRGNSPGATQEIGIIYEESQPPLRNKECATTDTETKTQAKLTLMNHGRDDYHGSSNHPPQENHRSVRDILSTSTLHYPTVLQEIEAAEKLGNCVIDFEI